jgi:hypothetical protein
VAPATVMRPHPVIQLDMPDEHQDYCTSISNIG